MVSQTEKSNQRFGLMYIKKSTKRKFVKKGTQTNG